MEDMASLWSYQESIEELKGNLLFTSLELESVKAEARDEMSKNREYVKHLVQLLQIAIQERDEARDQLQKLINKVMPSTSTAPEILTALPPPPPPPPHKHESPLLNPTNANSSITESSSLSETYNYIPHGSPPVDSLFNVVSSPELPNIDIGGDSRNLAFVNHHPLVQDHSVTTVSTSTPVVPSGIPKMDHASMIIDKLARGRSLPQKGKLQQAVLEAGLLLQTRLVAGQWPHPPPQQPSLPQWRNPPFELQQPLQIQPLSSHAGTPQMLPTSMLNFASSSSGSCLGDERFVSVGANTNSYFPTSKRQRFQ